VTLLMVEQMLPLALELCDRLYFLRNGRVVISGARPEEIGPQEIRSVYIF
jgi:ABC-type branched-subunit amino acid transport system ATPase component